MVNLIELRRKMRNKRPAFYMTGCAGAGKRKRVSARWRKPRGCDNKTRRGLRGYPKRVNIGYRGPKEVRDFHPSGLAIRIVNNVEDLKNINQKTEGARISSAVGTRKKVEIVKKCEELKIKVLNFKSTEDFLKNVKADLDARKAEKGQNAEEKKKKKEEKEKKAAEKERKEKIEKGKEGPGLDEKVELEEKKEKEDEEKQKVLTKRE
jgi:large subunit ribosomal protein L32e